VALLNERAGEALMAITKKLLKKRAQNTKEKAC